MKKGFTLVELIAVIAILGIVATIAMPSIMGIFSSKKQELYENTIEEIERITKNYLIDNPDLYNDINNNEYVDISISTLCSYKYIDCPILDPRDSSNIDGYIRISKDTDGTYEYTYMEDN